MAEKIFGVHINLQKNQLLNASMHNSASAPSAPALGQFYYNTGAGTGYFWNGSGWIDMGGNYSHPTGYLDGNSPTTAMSGATVISQLNLVNGHVNTITTRNLTYSDVGAASATHTHTYTDITNIPSSTVLGNNTGTAGPAIALTGSDLFTLMGLGEINLASLLAFPNSNTVGLYSPATLNGWLSSNGYVTTVNLSLGTTTATTQPITNSAGSGFTLPAATTSLAGLMTAADKSKLDGVAAGANNYTLPTATNALLGGVKIFDNTVQSTAANAVTTTASRTYGIQFNSSGQLVVNVPWVDTNTVYSLPTATSTLLGGVKLASDTVQSIAASAVTATASRTYGIQLNSSGQMVVNVPWVDIDTTYTAGVGLQLTSTTFNVIAGTSAALGGMKLFSDTVQTIASNAVTATASRTYGVQVNSSGQMVVNVPWVDTDTNTTYSAGTGLSLVGSTFSVNYGTTAGTAAQGNDARFHNAVTIGTANGLSLSTQQISLALANQTTAGAMSNTDKIKLDNIFVPGTNTSSTTSTWDAATINTAINNAVGTAVTGALIFIGSYNAATNTPNLTTNPSIKKGWTYVVSTAGTFLGEAVEPGDMIIAKTDNPGNTATNYSIINKNIPEIVPSSETSSGIIKLATLAEVQAGTVTDEAVTPYTLKNSLDNLTKYTGAFGTSGTLSYLITHSLGTLDIDVTIYRASDRRVIEMEWYPSSATVVSVSMNIAPSSSNEYLISVQK